MLPVMSKPSRSCTVCLAIFACFVLHACVTHDCPAQERAVKNLTQGKICRFSPKSNCPYCTDPDDPSHLTDGVTTQDHFWTQPGTVGWSGAAFATVSVDLGRVEPIYRVHRVRWSSEIRVNICRGDLRGVSMGIRGREGIHEAAPGRPAPSLDPVTEKGFPTRQFLGCDSQTRSARAHHRPDGVGHGARLPPNSRAPC